MGKPTHILYQLEDSGSHYRIANLVLYPGVPVPVADVPEWFLKRLLEEKIAAYCDQGGNLVSAADGNLGPDSDEDPFDDSNEPGSSDEDSEDTLTDLPDPTKRKRTTRKPTEDKSPESTFGTS